MMTKIKNNKQKAPMDESEIEPLNDGVLEKDADSPQSEPKKPLLDLNNKFVQISLGMIAIAVVILTVWGVGTLIIGKVSPMAATQIVNTEIPKPQVFITPIFDGKTTETTVDRFLDIQTTVVPAETEIIKERTEVLNYSVMVGDTIFGIADKFGLKPETVLWSNIYTLGDSPDGISIGTELIILPVDGLVYIWTETDGLNGVSNYFQVTPEDIINYPLNELDSDTIGDWSLPNIPVGKMLVVPGGKRPTVSWVVARTDEAVGNSYLGPGACSGTIYGAVGTGSYIFPTDSHALSGYDYNPPVHNGLDFEGRSGWNIYAIDTGVIVYSGWSDRGYGNLVVVDHDNGVQSMYAHLLDGSFLPCGSNVYQGDVIGLMGSTGNSTGPHLHFELRFGGSPVNPWLYLQ